MATHKNREQRPIAAPPDIDFIPAYVRNLNQWVLWRYDWKEDEGHWSKVPYDACSLSYASTTNPLTWSSFAEAVESYRQRADQFAGIGFVFSEDDDVCGVDFDDCLEMKDGKIYLIPFADRWVSVLDTYTELSPSGTGLHSICRARLIAGRKSPKPKLEVYDRSRYFTFTGRSYHHEPRNLESRQDEVSKLISEVFPKPVAEVVRHESAQSTPNIDVKERLGLAFNAANGNKIKRLFDGDVSEHGNDDSSADLALCNLLAFYSNGHPDLLDAMFRQSKLMRSKWDKKHYSDGRTYGQETINKALTNCTTYYGSSVEVTAEALPGTDEDETDGIRCVEDYAEDLEAIYETGFVPGADTGWGALDDLYTVKPGQWTVVTGTPTAGKSVWLNALLVNLAIRHDWRFIFCSPEFWPVPVHIAELQAIYVGKPLLPGPHGRMSKVEAFESKNWVGEHFKFLEYNRRDLTVDLVIADAERENEKRPIQGLICDPWTDFVQDRQSKETETEFTKRKLTEWGKAMRRNQWHGWWVAHPEKLRRDKDGQYPVPTLYDISGSAHWYNKCFMGISLHRPNPEPSTKVQLHVQKVKQRWCGKKGIADLYYEPKSGRYSEYPMPAEIYRAREQQETQEREDADVW